MNKYEVRTIKTIVVPVGEPIFSEQATTIEIEDEAAGEFVKITQQGGSTDYAKWVCFAPDEWAVVRAEIDRMVAECRSVEDA